MNNAARAFRERFAEEPKTLHELVSDYCAGRLSADDYYAAVERLAREAIQAELRSMAARG